MRHKNRNTLTFVALCLMAAIVPACGSGGSQPKETPPTETSAPPTPTHEATAVDEETTFMPVDPSPTRRGDGSIAITPELIPENTTASNIGTGKVTMNGVDYPSALILYGTRNVEKIEINAGRRYERFRGSLSIPDDEPSDSSYQVDISLDGEDPVYSALVRFGETKEVDIPIKDVLRVRIELVSVGDGQGELGIGNPRFD